MFRTLRTAVVWSLALSAVTVSVHTSLAGCGGHQLHHYHRSYYQPPVVPLTCVVARPVAVAAAAIVAPVQPSPSLPSVPAGSTLTLPGNFLGTVPGHVFLVLNDVKLPSQVMDWTPNGVTITLPPMAVKHPSPARLDVVLPHGQVTRTVEILLTPPAPIVLHPTAPASPLPTGPVAAPATPVGQAAAPVGPQIGLPVVQM